MRRFWRYKREGLVWLGKDRGGESEDCKELLMLFNVFFV